MSKSVDKVPNEHRHASAWLQEFGDALRPFLAKCGYTLPENIRYWLGFTSTGRRGKDTGQAIFPAAAGGHFIVIIRCDAEDPVMAGEVLMHQFGHVLTGKSHGREFAEFCDRTGMETANGLRNALAGWQLRDRLNDIADSLGPLPHRKVNFDALAEGSAANTEGEAESAAADRPAKQNTNQRKAECLAQTPEGVCGYTVRVTTFWVEKHGAPVCPCEGHGPMFVHPRKDAAGKAPQES